MAANFKRVEKLIIESGHSYLPLDWAGNNDMSVQEALLDRMLMYILKLNLDKNLSEDVWYVEAKFAVNEYAFWYAADIFDDLSIFYDYKNLVEDIQMETYKKPKKLREIYELYIEHMENQPSAFYKKIYEFVDECLQDNTWLED
jgi:hypothetical protein